MKPLSIFLLTVGFTLSFVGVVGNLIIISFLIKKKGMKNKLNRILFTNLAVADLSVLLFFHTYQALSMTALIQESNITCRVVQPISYAFVTVSVMSLLLISFHRHRVITREMDQEWSETKSVFIILFIWLGSFVSTVPMEVLFYEYEKVTSLCIITMNQMISNVYYALITLATCVFPLIAILVLFIRMKIILKRSARFQQQATKVGFKKNLKAVKILLPVVVVYWATTFPYFLLDLTYFFSAINLQFVSTEKYDFLSYLGTILLTTNSAVNPFIYVIVSRDFRQALKNSIKTSSTNDS